MKSLYLEEFRGIKANEFFTELISQSNITLNNQEIDLLQNSIIAGGAVSKYFVNNKFVVNDIDVYVDTNYDQIGSFIKSKDYEVIGKSLHSKLRRIYVETDNLNDIYSKISQSSADGYSRIRITTGIYQYNIAAIANYKDVFNLVAIRMIYDESVSANKRQVIAAGRIISSFDLNASQCSLVYNHDESKWYFCLTKEYMDFLESNEILILNPYTPTHSLLRAKTYQEELGSKIKYNDKLIKLFARYYSQYFGDKYADKLSKYNNDINFTYDQVSDKIWKVNNPVKFDDMKDIFHINRASSIYHLSKHYKFDNKSTYGDMTMALSSRDLFDLFEGNVFVDFNPQYHIPLFRISNHTGEKNLFYNKIMESNTLNLDSINILFNVFSQDAEIVSFFSDNPEKYDLYSKWFSDETLSKGIISSCKDFSHLIKYLEAVDYAPFISSTDSLAQNIFYIKRKLKSEEN